jgi:TonB-linked SusC/RagA family outer membrane protein
MRKREISFYPTISAWLLALSVLFFNQDVHAQRIPVSGTVKNADGQAIEGASVSVKGSSEKTITNAQGQFKITVPDRNATLVFSSLGFAAMERNLNGQTVINVAMTSEVKAIDEVVVVGFGTQRKVSVTGAISSVKSEEILRSPVSSVANAIAGRTTGVLAVQRGGEPGRDIADIYVRGIATFAGGNSTRPLVLVDGVERSLAGIDPYTIESFNILKDASATAVFGVRGANGVIIITTKTGQKGRPQFSFSSNFAFQNPIRLPKLLDAVDYATYRNEAEANDVGPGARKFSDYDIERFRKGDDPYFHPNIDWFDYMLKKSAPQQLYNLNISGGGQDSKYFVSLGYLNQDGAYKLGGLFDEFSANPNYKRYNIRTNFDFNLSEDITVLIKAASEIGVSNYANSNTSDIFNTILSANPIMSPVLYQGKLVRNVEGLTAFQISNTPLYQMLFNGFNRNFSNRFNSNIAIRYKLDKITKGLLFRAMGAYDSYYLQQVRRTKVIPMWDLMRNRNATTFQDSIVPIPVVNQFEGPINFGGESFARNRKFYAEAAIEYSRNFNGHNITALGLGMVERFYSGGNELPFNYAGLVGRLSYAYNNKYLFDFNAGLNGSENFAVGKQFGFFPSFSVGYVLTEEKFIPKQKLLTYMKLRGSYGKVGNDKIGGNRFLFLPSSFTAGSSYFFGLNNVASGSFREASIGNPNVTWEVATKWNIGADMRLFSNKVNFSVDVFNEQRENILWNLNVPITFGSLSLISPYNIGQVKNNGVEFELGFKDEAQGGKLKYWMNANYTFARNKIIYMDEAPQPFPGLAMTGNRIGQPKGLVANGIFNTLEQINDPKRPKSVWEGTGLRPGDISYADVNGDGIIDNNDQVNIGNPNIPEIIYGATFGVNWKGFELSVFFQGAGNVSTYLQGEAAWPFIAGTKAAFETAKQSWSEERYLRGDKITLPRLTASPEVGRHNYRPSSFWMQDAAYLRLKNVEFSYTFTSNQLRMFGLKGLRIYASGQNLVTWTKMPFFDPEIPSSNGAIYPMTRIFNLGANVQF